MTIFKAKQLKSNKHFIAKDSFPTDLETKQYEQQFFLRNNDVYLNDSPHNLKKVVSFDVISQTNLFFYCKKIVEFYDLKDIEDVKNFADYWKIHKLARQLQTTISELVTTLLIAVYEKEYYFLHSESPLDYDLKATSYNMKHFDCEYLVRFWFFSSYTGMRDKTPYYQFINHKTGESFRLYAKSLEKRVVA